MSFSDMYRNTGSLILSTSSVGSTMVRVHDQGFGSPSPEFCEEIIGTTHTFTLDHHRLSIRSMAVTMTSSLYKSVRHWSADDGDQVDKTACIVGLSSVSILGAVMYHLRKGQSICDGSYATGALRDRSAICFPSRGASISIAAARKSRSIVRSLQSRRSMGCV
jgi:hypothetical protein